MSFDAPSARPPLPQPLRRGETGRWLGGVCRGIATRWDIPVAQVRAMFTVAAVLGGIGVLAYAACWLVLPAEADDDAPSLVRGLASLALLAAACAGLATLAFAAGLATLFGFGWTVVVALGVFLVGALVAWPVVRPAWVLLPLAAVALPAVAVAASGVRIEAQSGVIAVAPQTPEDIPADGYRAGLGDLLVDLRELHAKPGDVATLRLHTGIGRTVVALPRDRCFDVDVAYRTGRAGAGVAYDLLSLATLRTGSFTQAHTVVLFGEFQSGDRGHWTRKSSDAHAPTLKIDFESVDGELWVRDYPDETGPLYEPIWPANVMPPSSPDVRRPAWRRDVERPAVQRAWRTWRRQVVAFRLRQQQLTAGACARRSGR